MDLSHILDLAERRAALEKHNQLLALNNEAETIINAMNAKIVAFQESLRGVHPEEFARLDAIAKVREGIENDIGGDMIWRRDEDTGEYPICMLSGLPIVEGDDVIGDPITGGMILRDVILLREEDLAQAAE